MGEELSFGAALRGLRAEQGLSLAALAQSTHYGQGLPQQDRER